MIRKRRVIVEGLLSLCLMIHAYENGANLAVIVPPNGQVQSILSDASSLAGAIANRVAVPVTPIP